MATTDNPAPILIPLVESDRPEVHEALARLSDAVLIYGAARTIDPLAETRPADHPEYVLGDLTPAQIVGALTDVCHSIGARRYNSPELLGLAEDCRDYLQAELLARLERRPDDCF